MEHISNTMEVDTHYILGVYSDEDDLKHGIDHIREKGLSIYEVFNPYPVHGLEKNLGYGHSWLPKSAFVFGALGTTAAIAMQTGMMGLLWPMIIGGKPFISIPDFVPVSFEMTVLFSAFGMVGSFLVSQDLKPYKVPRIFDRRSTDDKHIVAIDLAKNSLSEAEIKIVLQEAGAEEVNRKDFTEEENNPSFFNYLSDLFKHGVRSTSRPK
jgi:hypothetical protein